jgi:hypothetical protein
MICERSEREYPSACVFTYLGTVNFDSNDLCIFTIRVFMFAEEIFFCEKRSQNACFLHDKTIMRRSFSCAGVHYTETTYGVLAFASSIETSEVLH